MAQVSNRQNNFTVDDGTSVNNFVVNDGTSVENFDVNEKIVLQIADPSITSATGSSLTASETGTIPSTSTLSFASASPLSADDHGKVIGVLSITPSTSILDVLAEQVYAIETGVVTPTSVISPAFAANGTDHIDAVRTTVIGSPKSSAESRTQTLSGIVTATFADNYDDYGLVAESFDVVEDLGSITAVADVSSDYGALDSDITSPLEIDEIAIALVDSSRLLVTTEPITVDGIGTTTLSGVVTLSSAEFHQGNDVGFETLSAHVTAATTNVFSIDETGFVDIGANRTTATSNVLEGDIASVATLDGDVISTVANTRVALDDGLTIGILSISTSTSISATLSEKGLTNEVGDVTLVDVLPAAFSADGTDYIDGVRTSVTGSSVLADDTGLFTIEGIRTDVTSTVEQGVDSGTIDVDTDIVPASASTFQGIETGLAKDGTIENVTGLPSTPIAVGTEYIGGIRTTVTTTPATADDAGETFVNSQVTLFGSDVLEGFVSSTGLETTEVYESIVSIGTSIDVGVEYINGDKTYSSVDVATADDVAKTIGILNIPTSTAIVEPSKEYSASFDNASITPVSVLSPAFAANGTDYIDGIVTSANAQSTITDDRRLAADQPQDVDVIADLLVASERGLLEGEIYSVATSTETAIEQGTTESSADTQDSKGNVQITNDIGTSISDAADVGIAASPVTSAEKTHSIVSPNVEIVAAESTSTVETSSATDTAEANSVAATATTVQARGDIVVDLAVLDVSAKANQVNENSIWQPEASVTGSSTSAQSSTETTKANPGNVVLTVDVAFGTSTERTTTQEQDIEAEFGVTPKTTEDTGSSEIDGIISEAFANALEAVSTIPFMPGIDDFHVTPMIGYEGVDSDASIHYTRTRGGGYIKYTGISGSTRLMPVMDKVSASPDIKYNDIKGTPS